MLVDITLTVELEAEELAVVDGVQRGWDDKRIALRNQIPVERVKAIISSLCLVENVVVATRQGWARWSNFRLSKGESDGKEKHGAHLRDAGQRKAERKTG